MKLILGRRYRPVECSRSFAYIVHVGFESKLARLKFLVPEHVNFKLILRLQPSRPSQEEVA
jgi:hypothetical protein